MLFRSEGIITAQQIWFTHYQHLNDPSEMEFGMNSAKKALAEVGGRIGGVTGGLVKIFCEMVDDLFSTDQLRATFGVYIASFTRQRDDLRQWQVYAANGKGFALGLAPQLFAIEDKPNRAPHENECIAPVCYGDDAGRLHHLPAIESAARIVADIVDRKTKELRDINRGMPFFDKMGKALISAELLLNSLSVKHGAYEHEHEVRLFIIGEIAKLAPYVSARSRGTETVPFIKRDMSLQRPGSIAEIVIGPAAPATAEDFAISLLAPFHSDPRSIIHR